MPERKSKAKQEAHHLRDFDVWLKYKRHVEPLRANEKSVDVEQEEFKDLMTHTSLSQPEAVVPQKTKSESVPEEASLRSREMKKVNIQGRIDLHGLTEEKAHQAVVGYLSQCYAQSKRTVLVITGKGHSPQNNHQYGVLRTNFPKWLTVPPLSQIVRSYAQSAPHHGGSGAFYVFLKRSNL